MNLTLPEANKLVEQIVDHVDQHTSEAEVILCPPCPYLTGSVELAKASRVAIGAQNCSRYPSGAYTGEVSAAMIRSTGASHVIIGHSERRDYFHESSVQLLGKLEQAFEHELTPILCCGEPLQERNGGTHEGFVTNQLEKIFNSFDAEKMKKCIVAYEPIWAIGTGETATPEQAQAMHKSIRGVITEFFGEEVAGQIRILYGGSVKPSNAKELFGQPDIDGGLVGGASLKAVDFAAIIDAA